MPPLCACGCGQETNLYANTSLKYKGKYTKYKHPHGASSNRISDTERYSINAVTGCWEWLLGKNPEGYGRETHRGKTTLAHKRFYKDKYGDVPQGLQLDHVCKNRGCINPDHLQPVSNATNSRRGKQAKISKRVAEYIREIYATGQFTQAALARHMSLGVGLVNQVVCNKTWNTDDPE